MDDSVVRTSFNHFDLIGTTFRYGGKFLKMEFLLTSSY